MLLIQLSYVYLELHSFTLKGMKRAPQTKNKQISRLTGHEYLRETLIDSELNLLQSLPEDFFFVKSSHYHVKIKIAKANEKLIEFIDSVYGWYDVLFDLLQVFSCLQKSGCKLPFIGECMRNQRYI